MNKIEHDYISDNNNKLGLEVSLAEDKWLLNPQRIN